MAPVQLHRRPFPLRFVAHYRIYRDLGFSRRKSARLAWRISNL